MNQNFRKTALMVGAFSLLGLCYSPKAYAAEAPQVPLSEPVLLKKVPRTVL